MASTVLQDTFTDTAGTAITAHVGETNATYTYIENNASIVISDANRARVDSTTPNGVKATAAGYPRTTSFDLTATYFCKTVRISQYSGVGWRYNGLAPGSGASLYRLYYQGAGTPQWLLEKKIADVNTTIGSFVQTISPDTAYAVRIEIRGSDIEVFIDGVSRIDVTDASLPDAGPVLLDFFDDNGGGGVGSNTNGVHIDNLQVDDTRVRFVLNRL